MHLMGCIGAASDKGSDQRTNASLQRYAATQAREGTLDAGGSMTAVSSILGQGPQIMLLRGYPDYVIPRCF